MVIKKLPLLFALLVSCSLAYAQPALKWVAQIGGTADGIKPTAMAVSNKGEIVTAGNFYGMGDFNPGSAVLSFNYTNGGSTFITKLDSNKNLIWAAQIGNSTSDSVYINDIDIDSLGFIYVVGSYIGMVDVSPVGLPTWFTSQNLTKREAFIMRLRPSGTVHWAQNLEGGNGSIATSVKTYGEDVYITGNFAGTTYVTWGGVNITSPGQDMFLVKNDTGGTFQWIKTSSGGAQAHAVAIDKQGNAYVSGTFSGTTDFSPNVTGGNLTSSSNKDAFVAKFTSGGTLSWANQLAGGGNEEATSIAIDKIGNIIIGGGYTTSIDCDPGTGTFILGGSQPPQGCYGYFITKLTNAGNFVWALSPAASGTCDPRLPLALDTSNNIYITGDFADTLDFDPGSGTYNLMPNGPMIIGSQVVLNPDIFVSRINEDGSFAWARRFGSTYDNERGETIEVDARGRILIVGTFSDTVDFDPTFIITNLTAGRIGTAALKSMFIQKLWQCPGIQDSLAITNCGSFTFANSTYTSSGLYSIVFPTSAGCDSVVKLNLTIHNIDTSVTEGSGSLTAKETGATYQWINCYNRLNPAIPGATSTSFSTAITGVYAVIITKNGCSDTSSCHFLIGTAVAERDILSKVSLYPNPTNEVVTVNFGSLQPRIEIEVSNIAGQLVQKKTVINAARADLKIEGVAGIYIIKLTADNGQTTYLKLIKE